MRSVIGEILVALAEALYHLAHHLFYVAFKRQRIRKLLHRNSRYYNSLGARNKKKFERKAWDFIRYNKFVARDGLKITLSLKTIIASHATQLSLYLTDEAFDYYERIILYREYYLSRVTQKYHKAEVNPALKVIVFSVRAIYESLNRTDDGINVLLHEFAHALWLEHKLMGHEYSVFDDPIFTEVEFTIEQEFRRLQDSQEHFFRKYAFTDKTEFFAVAVENFFERPMEFNEALPELYQSLSRLFHQNPLTVNLSNR